MHITAKSYLMTEDRLVEDNGVERRRWRWALGLSKPSQLPQAASYPLPTLQLVPAQDPSPRHDVKLPTTNPHLSAKWCGMERQWLEKNRASGYKQSSTIGAMHGIYHPALPGQPQDPPVISLPQHSAFIAPPLPSIACQRAQDHEWWRMG